MAKEKMKYITLVPDGLADEPLDELNGQTPVEYANTPNMDYMAKNGMSGLIQTIPEGFKPGSDVGNLALLGYDPSTCYSGRAPLEAANMNIDIAEDEIVFRCNFVTLNKDTMVDYSAGHISTKEADTLIKTLNANVPWPGITFYTGKSYRHVMVMKSQNVKMLSELTCVPPHDILNQNIKPHLPRGKGHEYALKVMEWSQTLLDDHDVNQTRADLNENVANSIWLWGQGVKPDMPLLKDKYGVTGAIISAVDLVNGIGRLIGMDVIDVPGATGYYDTNYQGKADYALEALKTHDFVYVHVEAPDEAGHNGDVQAKVEAAENFDKYIVGTVLNHFSPYDPVRMLVLPDHPTPLSKRTHTSAPVPFAMFGKNVSSDGAETYGESAAAQKGLKFKSGEELISYFMQKK